MTSTSDLEAFSSEIKPQANQLLNFLNVGCGFHFSTSSVWTNIDIGVVDSNVIRHDIRKGLPYQDLSFDACYSSHVIEHLKLEETEKILAECWRVLKPNGIIRIVVPDLEYIARIYLECLDNLKQGLLDREADYDWIMLEFYDQVVRQSTGGKMGEYLSNPKISNLDFVHSRMGDMIYEYTQKQPKQRTFSNSFKSLSIQKLRNLTAKFLVGLIAGRDAKEAFEEGIFRNSGEIHRWMYDSFSLERLLKQTGFAEVCVCQASESSIPNFNSYQLDVVQGKIRKPDSLFIEAFKK